MKKAFLFWSILLVLSLVAMGLTLRSLALVGVPYHQSLVLRGAFCMITVLLYALANKLSIRPKNPLTQISRAAIAGLALGFFTVSYDYLSASAIAVLSNIDLPLMLAMGPLFGVASSKKIRLLACASIIFLVLYVSSLEPHVSLFRGLITLGVGTFLLCLGYLFIKKSMGEENVAVTIFVPALAIFAYGFFFRYFSTEPDHAVNFSVLMQAFVSGVAMFGAYYTTMKLYAITDIATAELPTLFSALLIQPLELWILKAPLEITYLLTSAAFVLCIYGIMILQRRIPEVQHA